MTVAPPRPIRLRSTSKHLRAAAGRFDRRIHARGAGADDQHIGLDGDGFGRARHGAVAAGAAKAAASRAANCRSISFALERSTGWPRLPSLPVKAASIS